MDNGQWRMENAKRRVQDAESDNERAERLMENYYDVIVIGGGVLGCFAARSLSRYASAPDRGGSGGNQNVEPLKIALLEKSGDICSGISRANTAIVYSGCDTKPGTTKTEMCVRAAQNFAALCRELGVRYSPCGSLMVCFGERGEGVLKKKLRDGIENGVRGARLLTRDEVLEMEPNISEKVRSGLFVPDTGTVTPWELCLAAAENAAGNGAHIILNTEVIEIAAGGGGFTINTNDKVYYAKSVVNCAGMAADKLHETVSEPAVRIIPTAGDYFILDTKASGCINHVIFHEPEEKGKGLTLVPTVDGNILIGPTERKLREVSRSRRAGGREPENISRGILETSLSKSAQHGGGRSRDPEYGYDTAREGLELLKELTAEVVPSLPLEHIIRSFGAIRPNPYMVKKNESGAWITDDKSVSDFCVTESYNGSFISLIGIKTPGLTCANELGGYTADKIALFLGAVPNPEFDPCRSPTVRLSELSFGEREKLVRENPDYGRIICRCRGISEGEINDAIERFPGAVSVDGIKRRTGAGSGRCQGGFCGQTVSEMLGSNTSLHKASQMCACKNEDYDIIVIGGGPAGMAAALSAARTSVHNAPRVLLIERAPAIGGILNQCTHTGFGLSYFGEELTGQEYARRFIERVESSGVEVLTDTMVLEISPDRTITLSGKKTGLARVRAKAVVLASGCRERPIGSLPVAGTRPAGIYTAGAAQKMMNLGGYDIGDRFVILGSGDVGMIVAREIVKRGKEVIAVIEKEDRCGGLPRNQVNCLERFGIPLVTNSTVSEVHGIGRVAGVTVTSARSPEPGTRSQEPGTRSQEPGTRSPEPGTRSQEPGIRSPEPGTRSQEPGTWSQEPGVSGFIECDTLITSVGLIPEQDLLDAFGGDLPDWLFLCGNACYVHDVVDDVSEESEKTGLYAAKYVLNGEAARGYQKEETRAQVIAHGPETRGFTKICLGCPKGCAATQTAEGWQGLACGRNAPV